MEPGDGAADALNTIAGAIGSLCSSYKEKSNKSAAEFLGMLSGIGKILNGASYASIPKFEPLLKAIGNALAPE
jgi:hypothetical protein